MLVTSGHFLVVSTATSAGNMFHYTLLITGKNSSRIEGSRLLRQVLVVSCSPNVQLHRVRRRFLRR